MSHLISFNLHLLAQQSEVHRFFTFDPVTSAWLLVPGMLLVAASIFYLYRAGADRLTATRGALTVIRVLLILLVFGLLLRPLWVWKQTSTLPQTVWILADQSLSMGQADTQATPVERLRWANATGGFRQTYIPVLSPPHVGVDGVAWGPLESRAPHRGRRRTSDARQQQEKFVRDLKHWRQMSETTIKSIARAPGSESGDGPAIVTSLEQMLQIVDRGLQTIDTAASRRRLQMISHGPAWRRRCRPQRHASGPLQIMKMKSF